MNAEIIAHEAALLAAMKSRDVPALDALLHEDLLFNLPTGQTATKALDLANYRSGGVRWESLVSRDLQVNVIGDCAVVAVTIALKGNYMGQEIAADCRYLRVWKQDGAGWKVIAGSVVPLA
jgi:ketosteroid isomerase-like protein